MSEYITMNYVDGLNGREFELFTGELLKTLGYKNVKVTRPSGDHGLDVLATNKNGIKIGIQCKHLGTSDNYVGFKAVEETFTGKSIYGADIGIILTNQRINNNAIKCSRKLGIRCWSRHFLEELIDIANNITHSKSNKQDRSPLPNTRIVKKIKYSNVIKWGFTETDARLFNLIILKSANNNYETIKIPMDYLVKFLRLKRGMPFMRKFNTLDKILDRTSFFHYTNKDDCLYILLYQYGFIESKNEFSIRITRFFKNLMTGKKIGDPDTRPDDKTRPHLKLSHSEAEQLLG